VGAEGEGNWCGDRGEAVEMIAFGLLGPRRYLVWVWVETLHD